MKTITINPTALYWASFNSFELRLFGQAVIDCSHSGSCDSDVAHWTPIVRAQVATDNFANKPTDASIRAELKEYGAWDDSDLNDTAQNWNRLVWLAAGNINDEESPDCTEPVNSKP